MSFHEEDIYLTACQQWLPGTFKVETGLDQQGRAARCVCK